ncbi:MAG: hypothetical protein ABEK29_01395, partial [Bradymonadaceae bacterium]
LLIGSDGRAGWGTLAEKNAPAKRGHFSFQFSALKSGSPGKPGSVPREAATVIHLGHTLPYGSSGYLESAERATPER